MKWTQFFSIIILALNAVMFGASLVLGDFNWMVVHFGVTALLGYQMYAYYEEKND